MEFGLQVELVWLVDGLHIEAVAQDGAGDLDSTPDARNSLGGWGEKNPGSPQIDRRADERSDVHFSDTGRLGDDQLGDPLSATAEVPGLAVEGSVVGERPGALPVG